MSYDLAFWRQMQKQTMPPAELYHHLIEDEEIAGIASLEVETVRAEFAKEFPEIMDMGASLDWEGDNNYFQISWAISTGMGTTQAIFATCGFGNKEAILNQIIDVAHRLGCAVYDPQVDQRFDQPA